MNKECRLDGLSILIAEDSAESMLVLRKALELRGASIEAAADGQLAFVLALTRPVDVVIMDIHMPKISGLEVVGKIRKEGSNLPVIALTGHEDKEDREKCLAAGCDGYMVKPANIDDMCVEIQNLVTST